MDDRAAEQGLGMARYDDMGEPDDDEGEYDEDDDEDDEDEDEEGDDYEDDEEGDEDDDGGEDDDEEDDDDDMDDDGDGASEAAMMVIDEVTGNYPTHPLPLHTPLTYNHVLLHPSPYLPPDLL